MAASAHSFIKSMLKFSVGSWASAAIAFISVPIITRLFSPEEFGKINMFMMAVGLIAAVVGLSMEQSYVRFFKEVSTDVERKKILTQCIAVVAIMFCIYFIANVIWGEKLSIALFEEINPLVIYLALPIMVISTIIMSYQSLYFRMQEQALGLAIISILSVLANKVAMAGAALYEPNYTIGIFFTAGSLLVFGILCLVFSKKSFNISFPKINNHQIQPLVKYALPLLPVSFITLLNTFVVRYILKDYVSFSSLGVFVAAFTIANILALVQAGFNSYWTPFLFANYRTEQKLIQKIHSGISFVMIILALLIILCSDFLFLILGEEYRQGKQIFAFLLIYPVVYTISETTSCGIVISKKTHLQTYSTVLFFLVNIGFAFFLVPSFGIFGAALSNAFGAIIFFLTRTFWGQREYISAEKLWRTLLAIAVLIFAAFLNYFFEMTLYRNMLITGCLVGICLLYHDVLRKGKRHIL